MNPKYPEIETAYDLGFSACAWPVWDILESKHKPDRKLEKIKQFIDSYYDGVKRTEIILKDRPQLKGLKDALDQNRD